MAVTPYLELFLPTGATKVADFVAGTADAMTKLDTWASAHAAGGGGAYGAPLAAARTVTFDTPRDDDGMVRVAPTDGTLFIDATDGSFFVSLPDSPLGTVFRFIRVDSADSNIGLTTPGDSVAGFLGLAPSSISPGEAVEFEFDGSNWWGTFITAASIPSLMELPDVDATTIPPGSWDQLLSWDAWAGKFVFGDTIGTFHAVGAFGFNEPDTERLWPEWVRFLAVDADAGVQTVDLPDAYTAWHIGEGGRGIGMCLTIQKTDSTDNAVILKAMDLTQTLGGTDQFIREPDDDTIGAPTLTLTKPGETVTLVSDGNWRVLEHWTPQRRTEVVAVSDISYSVQPTDRYLLVDASAEVGVTVNLPLTAPTGTAITVIRIDELSATSGQVAVAHGADDINGRHPFYVFAKGAYEFVCTDGTAWVCSSSPFDFTAVGPFDPESTTSILIPKLAPPGFSGGRAWNLDTLRLQELADMDHVSPGDGQALYWDATAGYWQTKPVSSPLAVFAASPDNTIGDGQVFLVDASGGAGDITLPAPTNGAQVVVKKVDATANAVNIVPAGAETIDGVASVALTAQYESRTLVSDGTNWWVI